MDEFQDPISFSIEFITLREIISEACEGLLRILEVNSGVGPGVKTGVKPGAGPGVGLGDFGGESPVLGGHFYQNQSTTEIFESDETLDFLPPRTGIASVRDVLRVRYYYFVFILGLILVIFRSF